MTSQQIKIENITMNEVLKAMHRLGVKLQERIFGKIYEIIQM